MAVARTKGAEPSRNQVLQAEHGFSTGRRRRRLQGTRMEVGRRAFKKKSQLLGGRAPGRAHRLPCKKELLSSASPHPPPPAVSLLLNFAFFVALQRRCMAARLGTVMLAALNGRAPRVGVLAASVGAEVVTGLSCFIVDSELTQIRSALPPFFLKGDAVRKF